MKLQLLRDKVTPNMNKLFNVLSPLLPGELIVDGVVSTETLFEFDGNFNIRDPV